MQFREREADEGRVVEDAAGESDFVEQPGFAPCRACPIDGDGLRLFDANVAEGTVGYIEHKQIAGAELAIDEAAATKDRLLKFAANESTFGEFNRLNVGVGEGQLFEGLAGVFG